MRVPCATYRLQLRGGMGFSEARALVPYLGALGIGALYLSPVTKARRGSTHGYDVADPRIVDPVLGTEQEFRALAEDLRQAGMGLVLDIVPNHMVADAENPWWADLLARGREARGARFFDIYWDPPKAPSLAGKILLPVLGRSLGRAIRRGELRARDDRLIYYDRWFPLAGPAGGDLATRVRRQHYRPAHWRVSSKVLGYRRFFDIDDLVAMRAEDPAVFTATHATVLAWVREGVVTGLRIDHVDGLTDPGGYLTRLRRNAGEGVWLTVEKILAEGEDLPEAWPVQGTTGYDFLAEANALFVDPAGYQRLRDAWREATGTDDSIADVCLRSRRLVLDRLLRPELCALLRRLPDRLHEAFKELTLALPVYRTYGLGDAADEGALSRAVRDASRRAPEEEVEEARRRLRADPTLLARWQQLTGPLMAKGFEDTTLYRHAPLVSRNEVGADSLGSRPFGDTGAFHAWLRRRGGRWPFSMNATATHDTKRGEDTRLRIDALSEIADAWVPLQERIAAMRPPGLAVEMSILLAQTLVGAWPVSEDRLGAYATKAAREAKRRTSWRDVDEAYEAALATHVHALIAFASSDAEFARVQREAARRAAMNAVSLRTLHVAAPGTPDLYQGTELADLSLVDPDNRRPVDFDRRRRLLEDLSGRENEDAAALASELLRAWPDGRMKMYVTWRALGLRRRLAALFAEGETIPLGAEGPRADHVVAFARAHEGCTVLAAVAVRAAGWARFSEGPSPSPWGDTRLRLPPGLEGRCWRDAYTGRPREAGRALPLAPVLDLLPAALLETGPRP